MDADFRVLGKIALGGSEEDKCADGIAFFGDVNTELFSARHICYLETFFEVTTV